MKQIVFIMLLAFLASCGRKEKTTNTPVHQASTPGVLLFHVEDLSQSNIKFSTCNTARELYHTASKFQNAMIKLVGIYDRSDTAGIVTLNVHYLDTPRITEKNTFKRAKLVAERKRLCAAYTAQAEADIARYCSFIEREHDGQYTDIAGALSLIEMTLSSSQYQAPRRKTFIVICSDMLYSPRQPKCRSLRPIHLPRNTTVLVVRPQISRDSLQAIFPDAALELFTSPEDAISFINSQTNN